MGRVHVIIVLMFVVCPARGFAHPSDAVAYRGRDVIRLDGLWDFKPNYVPKPETGDFPRGWQPIAVPGVWNEKKWIRDEGRPGEWGWAPEGEYRRTVIVPENWRGRRTAVHFEAVGSQATVTFNGAPIGEFTGDGVPFEFDVPSEIIRYGEPNELHVRVKDWHVFLDDADWHTKERPGPYVGPVNLGVMEFMESRGLYQPVELRAYPLACLDDIFVKTFVEEQHLSIQVEVRSDIYESRVLAVEAVVYDGLKVLQKLLPSTFVASSGRTTIELSGAMDGAVLWTPDTPKLYRLEVRLLDGDAQIDATDTRFGFRELQWKRIPLPGQPTERRPYPEPSDVSPSDTLFFLNGNPLQFRQATVIGSNYVYRSLGDKEWLRSLYTNLKKHNVNLLRTSAAVVPSFWLDLADETGLFIQTETGMFGSVGNLDVNNPVLYEHWERQLLAMVRRDRNHPSLAGYAVANEFSRQAMQGLTRQQRRQNEFRMLEIEAKCRRLDNTRPYLYEGDYNMQGWADIVCYHYPGPEPNWGATAFPNVCWWVGHQNLAEIAQKDISPEASAYIKAITDSVDVEDLYWHHDRPCMIGERSWFKADKPENRGFDLVVGERGNELERMNAGMALVARWNAEIDRIQGISRVDIFSSLSYVSQGADGFPPPRHPELAEAVALAYSPLIAVPHQYDHHFYSGARVARRFSVRNDTYAAQQICAVFRLQVEGRPGKTERHQLELGIGRQQELTVEVAMPEVSEVTQAKWRMELITESGCAYSREGDWKIYPTRQAFPKNTCIALIDPAGDTAGLLRGQGAAFDATDANALKPKRGAVAVLGANAAAALSADDAAALKAYVDKGGALLVLAQKSFPAEFGPSPSFRKHIWPENEKVTFAFPAECGHPVLKQFAYDDFTLWRDDHIVADTCFDRPESGNMQALLLAGNHVEPGGLCYAALVETAWGDGKVMFCQLKLLEKAGKEPVAAALLHRLLLHLSSR